MEEGTTALEYIDLMLEDGSWGSAEIEGRAASILL